ncbi:D-alanine--D-alanine ligase family protein [Natranaerofaba carboxydovora]|uniref:D-alanine--D-alanine ligase family protein n=1 Tax=Natranaerofaba carboxydovora TaxID=2742683 RepID=UPI001F142E19|nr:D-alanine--D-alanine ligase family protein [Natranaerofaba carboxydovora]UMZ75212.1 D-alanine--D-alanine ligase A [Natranaerofaba carboxydovora]
MSVKGKTKVVVVFGGRSGEHEVSLKSAKSVMEALDKTKFEIIPIGIKKDGKWISGDNPWDELYYNKESGKNFEVTLLPKPGMGLWRLNPMEKLTDVDVIFPVLHGTYGEDGTLQGFLELCDIPYVGSGVIGSSLGMDKVLMKKIFLYEGLKISNFKGIIRRKWEKDKKKYIKEIEETLEYPVFVKPANLGSSVGISKVKSSNELEDAVDNACKFDSKVVVEENIEGKEIEVSVLGNESPKTSVCGEIIPSKEFYDYEAKYLDDDSELIIPAPISDKLSDETRNIAKKAFMALDAKGLARIDFFVNNDTEDIYINEINTMPGFTEISMYPKLWNYTGISYEELLTEVIELSFMVHEDKKRNQTDFKQY